jgi:hypothetical protein
MQRDRARDADARGDTASRAGGGAPSARLGVSSGSKSLKLTLFGPLSETTSSVSWRLCALAGEKIAGAESVAATADAGLRKSRRFIESLRVAA